MIFLLLLGGCAGLEGGGYSGGGSYSGGSYSGGSSTGATGNTSAGSAIYSANCSGCHGSNAQGGSGPALAGISESSGVIDTILNGTSGMPGFANTLSDQNISDLLAYLSGLGGGGSSGSSGGGENEGEDD